MASFIQGGIGCELSLCHGGPFDFDIVGLFLQEDYLMVQLLQRLKGFRCWKEAS